MPGRRLGNGVTNSHIYIQLGPTTVCTKEQTNMETETEIRRLACIYDEEYDIYCARQASKGQEILSDYEFVEKYIL